MKKGLSIGVSLLIASVFIFISALGIYQAFKYTKLLSSGAIEREANKVGFETLDIVGSYLSRNETFLGYRLPITIQEQSGNNLNDYQILIKVNTYDLISQGKMNSDCSDIRFTWLNESSNQEIEIPYWIESGCNTQETRIWVKVPEIPANSNTTIYMYYGNPYKGTQNPKDVFIFYDNFSKEDPNWEVAYTINSQYSGTPEMRYENGWLHLNGTDISGYIYYSVPYSTGVGWALEGVVELFEFPDNAGYFAFRFGYVTAGTYTYNNHTWTINVNGTNHGSGKDIYANTIYRISLKVSSNHQELWINDQLYVSSNDHLNYPVDYKFAIDGGAADGTSRDYGTDWIALRKYVYPEPAVTLGNEENATTSKTHLEIVVRNPSNNIINLEGKMASLNNCYFLLKYNETFTSNLGRPYIKPNEKAYLSINISENCLKEENEFCIYLKVPICSKFKK